jgi:hypothetical protein
LSNVLNYSLYLSKQLKQSSMKREITKTEKKYLESLRDLKARLDKKESITMTNFIVNNHLNNQVSVVLIKKGIVKNLGGNRNPNYIWNTIDPNIRMVRAILNEMNNYERDKRSTILKKKKQPFTMPKKTRQTTETVRVSPRMIKENGKPKSQAINSKEIVLFWGLVKINIKTK